MTYFLALLRLLLLFKPYTYQCRPGCVLDSSLERSATGTGSRLRVPAQVFLNISHSRLLASTTSDNVYMMSASELSSMADSDQVSLDSVSTNATADDLPGPGRTIGLLYNFAGRHLEMHLGRAAERMGIGHRGTAIRTEMNCTTIALASENSEPPFCASDQASLISISTNATADNLPGAGRTLGLFYSFAGKHLETRLGRLAGRLGHGPRATALRIQENSGIVTLASVLPRPLSLMKARNRKIQKDCKRLLKYVGSNALSTRGQALDLIIDLSLDDHIRNFLKVVGAEHLIELAHKELFIRYDCNASLLSRSRKALVSVADDALMQEIKTLSESGGHDFIYRYDNVSDYMSSTGSFPRVLDHEHRYCPRMGECRSVFKQYSCDGSRSGTSMGFL
ncbi:hypothetical protein DFH11DRAFT_142738 [Phellopilus nigrolimitatus]|nr:hypothetical protein DFH11DRAFT_142738 [Phellopilus nigrolimitatus]